MSDTPCLALACNPTTPASGSREFCSAVEDEMRMTHITDTDEGTPFDFSKFVRRSARNPEVSHAIRPDVWKLREKIKNNDASTVVLKLKDHSISDMSSVVLDMILQDLNENTVCQALYAQNISEAMGEAQLLALTEVLKKKRIWCLNVGENYQISVKGWERFSKDLKDTNVTHLYVSEHTIPLSLKNEMRDNIRANRKKHTLHCSEENMDVIERCTHCWWNPINHFKHKVEQRLLAEQREKNELVELEEKKKELVEKRKADRELKVLEMQNAKQLSAKKRKKSVPQNDEFAGEKWFFSCSCGEKCSYFDNPKYHPKGAQFQCGSCGTWAHIKCVLGKLPTDETENVYCAKCKTVRLREERNKNFWSPVVSMNEETKNEELIADSCIAMDTSIEESNNDKDAARSDSHFFSVVDVIDDAGVEIDLEKCEQTVASTETGAKDVASVPCANLPIEDIGTEIDTKVIVMDSGEHNSDVLKEKVSNHIDESVHATSQYVESVVGCADASSANCSILGLQQ